MIQNKLYGGYHCKFWTSFAHFDYVVHFGLYFLFAEFRKENLTISSRLQIADVL